MLNGKLAPKDIRTLALVGPAAAGKTTLVDALLARAGAIPAVGSVEKGTAVCDFDALEKKHQHSLASAVASFGHAGTRIHLVDTPGLPDFASQAIGALAAVETAAVVVSATAGIEMVATRAMDWARRRNLCRVVIVNKIDAENVDLPALLESIREAFGKECLPINLPAGSGARVVDAFFNPSGEADFSSIEAAHNALVDQVVEVDDALMSLYLEQGWVEPDQLHAPFEKALREGHIVPVCFVSARNGAGVAELLDVIVKLLPNPLEGNPPEYVKGEGEQAAPIRAEPDPSLHVLAEVFKVSVDPFLGRLGVFRVHQGTVRKDTQLYIGDGRKPFKVGHLYMLRGKERIEVDEGVPGDICAVARVDDVVRDAILHDAAEDDHIHLRPLELPVPVFGLAVQTRKHGDEQKLWEVFQKLLAEDACLKVEHVVSTNETVIKGLGEVHLRTTLERLADIYKLEVMTRPPKVDYRETITSRSEAQYRHKKQTGGAGQFGEVWLRVEPLPRGSGFEFVDEVKGGTIPGQFIPAVEKGVRQALEGGPLAGFPIQDVRVVVYDGKHHDVDSNEISFVIAARKAFADAVLKARPLILEPIVNLDVAVPEQYVGDITGDISGRRGQISGTDSLGARLAKISARVPLAELANYQSRLTSMTAAQGSYTLEFSHYEPVPPNIQQQLVREHAPKKEED